MATEEQKWQQRKAFCTTLLINALAETTGLTSWFRHGFSRVDIWTTASWDLFSSIFVTSLAVTASSGFAARKTLSSVSDTPSSSWFSTTWIAPTSIIRRRPWVRGLAVALALAPALSLTICLLLLLANAKVIDGLAWMICKSLAIALLALCLARVSWHIEQETVHMRPLLA